MSVLTEPSRPIARTATGRSTSRRSLRQLTRNYFAHERKWQFIIEAALFAVIVAISAWPIFMVADALMKFVQSSAS